MTVAELIQIFSFKIAKGPFYRLDVFVDERPIGYVAKLDLTCDANGWDVFDLDDNLVGSQLDNRIEAAALLW
jgi:hypothetical protein